VRKPRNMQALIVGAHVYRGPSRGPCIGIIYTHPSRVGGIHPLFSPSISIYHRMIYTCKHCAGAGRGRRQNNNSGRSAGWL